MALDLSGVLMGRGSATQNAPTQNALNRKAQIAQMLLQGSTGTINPLVAALGGFLGTSEMMNIADQQGQLDISELRRAEEERQRKIANEERTFGLEERKLDINQSQFEQELALKRRQLQETIAQNRRELENAGIKLTKGDEAVDKKFADEFVEFNAKGGFADVQKGINQLKEVRDALVSGEVGTGAERAFIPSFAEELLIPKSKAAQEAVEEVVQRNLRVILGAQFTEKEGERLIARAYNPKLPEKENIKRIDRLILAMEQAATAKEQASKYFMNNGTLKGYRGITPTIDMIEKDLEKPSSTGALIGGKLNLADPKVQQAFDAGYSEEQIIKFLGGK